MDTKIDIADFQQDSESGVWLANADLGIRYSDGDAVEDRIFAVVSQAKNVDVFSPDLIAKIRDWPSEYHFSPRRANLLRIVEQLGQGTEVLELGCGCGAITKALAERGCKVDAVEGSFRRARVAAKRTALHDDVRIFHSNFQTIAFDKQYDVVTLIGVLEYSPVYLDGTDPFIECLKIAAQALKPGGTLLIAIENKLGIKYLAGVSEDHHSQPFYGVEGRYGQRQATTYGKRELARRLQLAGFASHAFYYAYPDYKLPEVIVSDEAFAVEGFRVDDMLWGLENRDYSGVGKPAFNIDMAYEGLYEEGVLGDLANSFLIMASKAEQIQHRQPGLLAQKYTDNRRPELNCQTSFMRDGEGIAVCKAPLLGQPVILNDTVLTHQFTREDYAFGRNLGVLMKRAIYAADTARLLLLFQRYRIFLENSATDGRLPAEWLDALPANIITDAQGRLTYVDREWRAADQGIDLETVFARGVISITGDPLLMVAFPGGSQYGRVASLYANLGLKLDPEYVSRAGEIGKTIWQDVHLDGQWYFLDQYRLAERVRHFIFPAPLPFSSVGTAGVLPDATVPAGRHIATLASYDIWLQNHTPREVDAEVWAERMLQQWQRHPHMTMLVLASESDRPALQAMLEQMQGQLYKNWRLIVLADWPAPSPVFHETDYLGWLQLDDLGDPAVLAEACNGILEVLPTDWVTMLPAGARFAGEWLFSMADHVNRWRDKTVLYSDHDHLAPNGSREEPWFKPDFDPDYFYAMDYIGFAAWFSVPQLMAVGGFAAAGYWQHYDAVLRLFERYGRNTVGHVPRMLLSLPCLDISTEADETARSKLLQAHFEREGIAANVLHGRLEGTLRVEYLHDSQPLVSIIIPNRDKLEFLEPCVETLLEKTQWPHWELLIVDNQSSDPDTLAYYRELEARLPGRCRIVSYDAPFNFSAQCNLGAASARGDYLLLLNNDTEIVHAEWLDRMMAHAMRPEVGVVGCRLVYPESGKIQHAGVAFAYPSSNPDFVADHPFIGADGNAPGYMNRIWVEQNWSAVTAACLLTRKQVYQEVGGFDAEQLAVLFNDVDYCLKVGEQGYQVLYTPFATVVHHGSVSINSNSRRSMQRQLEGLLRALCEREVMLKRWLTRMAHDPAMNPNLLYVNDDFGVAQDYAPRWDIESRQRCRILGLPVSGGSGIYRVRQPLAALAQAGRAHGEYALSVNAIRMPTVIEVTRLQPDVLLVQNPITDQHHDCLQAMQTYMPSMMRVASVDDLLSSLPEKSNLYRYFKGHFRDAKPRLRKGLALCDRLIVSTEPLREFCADMIDDIRVVPNRLPKAEWSSLNSLRGVGRKPRVGWVGAHQHAGDLALVRDVVCALADEVEWVFMGMWPEGLDDVALERHEAVPYEAYPAKMASLNLDLAIAPLETHAFNEAKSNLRLLEYGAMRWPVVCSDVYPYRTDNPPVTLVGDNAQAWVDAIRQHLADPIASQAQGEALRRWVEQGYWLEDHLDEWLTALQPRQ